MIGKARDILEVQNAIALYDQLENLDPFSMKDFLLAHKILMDRLIAEAGKFRSGQVGVLKGTKVSHLAPGPKMVPELMNRLFSWARKEKKLHPLIKGCLLHYEIEFIHPFANGNGRMGRFWQTLTFYQSSALFQYIPIENLVFENQKKYYQMLEKSDRSGDVTYFIESMLEMTLEAINQFRKGILAVRNTYEQRIQEARTTFNNKVFSRQDYMLYFKSISTATASRDLLKAAQLKLLKKSGSGNQTKYRFID